jgi:vacuolar-type H+-ATPase subunit E/Vma4
VQASLRQALELAQKRLKQHLQVEGAWKALSVQMDTLEKAFDFLKSHILGIGSGAELSEELDNLVSGVSTVTELEASTNELMEELRGQGARAARVVSLKG